MQSIAIFASAFHPSLGGVEELVRQLAHAYRARGHRVIIVTNRYPETLPAFEEYEGIPIHRVAMRAPDEIRGASAYWKSFARYHLSRNAALREIVTILKENRTDILHIQCVSSNAFYAAQAAHLLHLPLVVTAQGEITMDVDRAFQRSRVLNRWLYQAVKAADFVTGCSQKTLDDLQSHLRISLPDKSQAIYNGANLADFHNGRAHRHQRPYALAIGRMATQKGFDVLLRAWAQIEKEPEVSGMDLIIAGEGPERTALEKLADELNIRHRVLFPGRADRAQTVALFKGCSFFILPSRADEGFPLVGVEAMAAGKAMVATPTGGLPEIVRHEESALIVPKDDVAALAAGIRRLAGDEAFRQSLALAAHALAPRFDWPAIADEYLAVYERVLTHYRTFGKAAAPRSTSQKVSATGAPH